MKQTIAVDMDGVIADTETLFINWYERDYGVRITPEDLNGKTEHLPFPVREAIRRYVYTPGFFRSIPVMPGAVEALRTLMERFEIYIVSAAMEFPQSLNEKLDWLGEHFPFISWTHIIFCGNKNVVHTDYMIDDFCKNLDGCKGKTLMFHAYHNGDVQHHTRVRSWDEVLRILAAAEARE